MAPSSSSSKAQASTSSSTPFAKLYNGSFLPSSLGNAVACYSSATFAGEHDSNSSSKGKGKSTAGKSSKGKGAAAGSDDGDVKFVEFDTLKRSRRTFTTETYTVYASLQIIASKFRQEELEDVDHRALALRNEDIPPPEQVSYYSRFAQLYREAINRYLLEISSQNEIDTEELATMQAIRDVFHLAHIIYVPADGRGDGIASEEVVDWLNNTSPYPSAERREQLTSMAAPYENPDFWEFVYSCVLRGHFELASSILSTLTNHPSTALKRLTQSCLDLLSEVPRSTSHIYAYESNFLSAFRKWRSQVSAIIARLEVEMDEFQEEIEEQEREENGDDNLDACADERLSWQAGFSLLLRILVGDVEVIGDASEDGWRSALAAWCLLVRPGLKRDDLPETIESIIETNPPDPTLFKETMSIALLSGDIAKVLDLAADEDTWLVTHLSDLFAKLGLLRDSRPVEDVSLRDWFILSYTDLLISDPGLWRITVDYYASMDNVALGTGRMREYLLSIGSTSPIETSITSSSAPDNTEQEDDATRKALDEGGMEVVEKVKAETSRKLASSVEGVLAACAMYGLEDVARSVCLMTAEALIAQKKYGLAVAYCVRANDPRRINKICDLILDEYVYNGESALALIDSIPTSLLRPSSNSPTSNNAFNTSIDMFSPLGGRGDHEHSHSLDPLNMDDNNEAMHANALSLVASTRLGFLARYRDFHALYASGERRSAAELLVLLMSSNAAPKRFWAIMLLDSVALLNSEEIVISEQDTLELMRCLNEIVTPVEKSGKRDIYGHLTYLVRAASLSKTKEGNKDKNAGKVAKRDESRKADKQIEEVEAALRQLEVVRYSLSQNLARCFMG